MSTAARQYRLRIHHFCGEVAPGAPSLADDRASDTRFVLLTGCPACGGLPATCKPPRGFDASVVITHDPACASMREAVALRGELN